MDNNIGIVAAGVSFYGFLAIVPLGARKIGLRSSALATAGLAVMKKRGSAPKGIALLGMAAALTLLGRDAATNGRAYPSE